MAYIRRKVRVGGRAAFYRKRVGRGAGLAARMRMGGRRRFNAVPTFTETFKMTTLNGDPTTGVSLGLLQAAASYIPQFGDYAGLYNQYCIRSATFIMIPAYNSYDSTNVQSNPASITLPRLVYAVNDSAQQPAPVSEADVLSDNGCKIRMLDRPIRIRCRPVAQVGVSASTGGFVSESKRNRWLSTANPEVLHTGASFAISQSIQSTLPLPNMPLATLYCKLTFSLRDPK